MVGMRGMAEKTAIARLTRATGRATIVASTDSQPALEGYKGHGMFTYVLLEAFHQADAQLVTAMATRACLNSRRTLMTRYRRAQ
jgi:hypothetical protein